MLLSPLVLLFIAESPMATFLLPVVLFASALVPVEVLSANSDVEIKNNSKNIDFIIVSTYKKNKYSFLLTIW